MRELTKAEREIMVILWQKEYAFVQDIISEMKDPKPANSTVATVLKVLEQKGVVAHETFGRNHRYYPLVKKDDYSTHFIRNLATNFFGGSVSELVSSFSEQEDLSVKELEDLKSTIENLIRKKTE